MGQLYQPKEPACNLHGLDYKNWNSNFVALFLLLTVGQLLSCGRRLKLNILVLPQDSSQMHVSAERIALTLQRVVTLRVVRKCGRTRPYQRYWLKNCEVLLCDVPYHDKRSRVDASLKRKNQCKFSGVIWKFWSPTTTELRMLNKPLLTKIHLSILIGVVQLSTELLFRAAEADTRSLLPPPDVYNTAHVNCRFDRKALEVRESHEYPWNSSLAFSNMCIVVNSTYTIQDWVTCQLRVVPSSHPRSLSD